MSLKRCCDKCNTPIERGDRLYVDYNFKPDGVDMCEPCYEDRAEERGKACDRLPDEASIAQPKLGYTYFILSGEYSSLLSSQYLAEAAYKNFNIKKEQIN